LLDCEIPGSDLHDARGCYPIFTCQNWGSLQADLELLDDRLVCVRLVTDPFADVGLSQLARAFPDACFEFKQHYFTDLSRPLDHVVRGNHARNVRKAANNFDIRRVVTDDQFLTEWSLLYEQLVLKHGITGIARFSRHAFERQLAVPGLTAFAAYKDGELCGATLWYAYGEVAYYHLAAYNEAGYAGAASFGLFWQALMHFQESGVARAALGAAAGVQDAESGLTRFKRGWATDTRPVYFCGRILQPNAYQRLVAQADRQPNFFPAYRSE
jgi:hypothetical protein